MNRKEVVDAVNEKTGYTKTKIDDIIKALLETITESLENGEKVLFVGFGAFDVRHRDSRKGRNPATGEPMTIPEARVPKFRAGKNLKERVNNK